MTGIKTNRGPPRGANCENKCSASAMKTAIYFIVIIIWAVLQARRKAMRAQKRKQAETQNANQVMQQNQPQPLARGPVTAEENRPL
ncbi:MAG TPA: hypothetical protein VGM92_05285, partial [Candidatus Kapabacteria bacterium]